MAGGKGTGPANRKGTMKGSILIRLAIVLVAFLSVPACQTTGAQPAPTAAGTGPASSPPAPEVTELEIRDVTGRKKHAAVALLEGAGFSVSVIERYSKKPEARVLWVKPAPGTVVEVGTRLRIGIAEAYPLVPDVLGLGIEKATKLLKEAGYKVERMVGRFVEPGEYLSTVIASSPPPGGSLLPGRVVTIVTPSEPPVPSPVPVPVLPPAPVPDFDPCDYYAFC